MRPVLLATAVLGVISTAAFADETLKYRSVYHIAAVQSQEVPDTDGHVISLIRASGLASLPDGSVATDNLFATVDYVKGSGPIVTYGTVAFGDGSVLFTKFNGMGTTDGTKTSFKGTLTILGGKGRYEGAKGDGTAVGARIAPQPAAGAQLYNDIVLNIKK
jgi:hypothetical protein